jgi:hypothetical protein
MVGCDCDCGGGGGGGAGLSLEIRMLRNVEAIETCWKLKLTMKVLVRKQDPVSLLKQL